MGKRWNNKIMRQTVFVLGAVLILSSVVFAGAKFGNKPIIAADTPDGDVKSVIVKFKNVGAVTSTAGVERQQEAIAAADKKVADATPYAEGYKSQTRSYDNLPYAVYTVDKQGEASLKADPNIEAVFENTLHAPLSTTPIPVIGGLTNGQFSDGTDNFDGTGYAVAVLDTGVDKNNSLLSGLVISEACFGENGVYANATVESLCPGAVEQSTATDSALDCVDTLQGCSHGTHVAGSVAMPYTNAFDVDGDTVANDQLGGVAVGAKIIAVKVFSKVTSASLCPTAPSNECVLASTSAQLAAMDYIATLSVGMPIAAVNMSLGGAPYAADTAECSASSSYSALASAISTLRSKNIATVIANGNDGDNASYYGKIATPACVSGAVSVGATNVAGNAVASYSNNGALTDLLAPGGDYDGTNSDTVIWSAENGTDGIAGKQGTSMAAPMVAGAFAVLREAHPNASVASLTSLMQSTGVNVTDTRTGYNNLVKPRLNLAAALAAAVAPTITSFTGPGGTLNEGTSMTVEATVSDATSCSLNNGVGSVAISGGAISESVPVKASYVLTCVNDYGDTATSTLNSTVNTAPTTPAAVNGEYDENAKTLTISWTASTDTDGIQEYRVYVNGQLVSTLSSTETTYVLSNVLADEVYTIEVRAVDTLGAISLAGSFAFGDTTGEEVSVPNTGLAFLQEDAFRGLIVAVLGLAVALVAAFAIRGYVRQR